MATIKVTDITKGAALLKQLIEKAIQEVASGDGSR